MTACEPRRRFVLRWACRYWARFRILQTAYTTADRGQIVHHDPFGDAAESYRTASHPALQFGMPAGAKTLLITSPMSGDGKSTFVSNLGIAMAQASRRVLIIDADLRAPMQHRIFNLKDRSGLASVLGGADTMDQGDPTHRDRRVGCSWPVVQHHPTPPRCLNSPAFAEHLNDLADKYDIVLLDSPPVTAVADARILAASVDLSMMVIRLDSSTRKQAEAARDGLRSVGGPANRYCSQWCSEQRKLWRSNRLLSGRANPIRGSAAGAQRRLQQEAQSTIS